jgi:hypothetical protein
MVMPVSTKVKKCLRYSHAVEWLTGKLPKKHSNFFQVGKDEECIALYHNRDGTEELILITNKAIHLRTNGTYNTICYSEINNIRWLEEDKVKAALNPILIITMVNGTTIDCPVRGSWYSNELNMGGPDIASFHTFLLGAKHISKITHKSKHL